RTYMKIYQVLAQSKVMSDIASIVFLILCGFYSGVELDRKLINSLYSFPEMKKGEGASLNLLTKKENVKLDEDNDRKSANSEIIEVSEKISVRKNLKQSRKETDFDKIKTNEH